MKRQTRRLLWHLKRGDALWMPALTLFVTLLTLALTQVLLR